MNGIRTGLDEKGNKIGLATIGLPRFTSPNFNPKEIENQEDVI
jgi:hypothetical protein